MPAVAALAVPSDSGGQRWAAAHGGVAVTRAIGFALAGAQSPPVAFGGGEWIPGIGGGASAECAAAAGSVGVRGAGTRAIAIAARHARSRRCGGVPRAGVRIRFAGVSCVGTVGGAAGVTLCTATRKLSMSESTSSSEKLGWPRGSLTSTLAPSPSSTLNRSRRNCELERIAGCCARTESSFAPRHHRHGDVDADRCRRSA